MSAAMFFTYLRNCGTSLLPSLSASLSPSPLLRRFRRVSSSSDPLQSIHILGESCRFNMGLLNNSIENSTLDCPIYTKDSEYWMEFINFWVGGVVQTLFILFGFVGNLVFIFILTRKELRNSFNLLLVALALFDLCFLLGAQLESIRVSFGFSTNLHIILFPYLLYPGKELAMTVSIFMIVAIALERYVAVHNPIDYKQATNDAQAIRRRLAKYLLPVIFSAVLFNIPKFFEGSYGYHYELDENGFNQSIAHIEVTPMRAHPIYSYYANWSQSLVQGFIPAVLLMYFNTKIYLNIRGRERRKRPQSQANDIAGDQKGTTTAMVQRSKPEACDDKNGQNASQIKRRKAEDQMAMMFVAIVSNFLVTNFPRILLNFHEMFVIETFFTCSDAGLPTFPVWSRILHTFAMLLMILNSSMNILFYGFFNTQFRKVARALIRKENEEFPRQPKNHKRRETIELEAEEPVEV